MRIKQSLALSCLWIAVCGAAAAQAPPASSPPAQTAPTAPARGSNDCAPMQQVPGSNTPHDSTTTGQSREPLGDKLAKSDGVLCPPSGVDPEIHAPTPNTGNMPVIRPPGSPGGDPSVRPK
jgi:hypothetical protein